MKFKILKPKFGVFGICPPCADDDDYPNYLCDPCDTIVQAGGLKGWIAKKCTYTFADITDSGEWDTAIANKDVFGRVNGSRILGESPAPAETTKQRGSCGTPELVKLVRTATFQDAENDANFSVNDIYVFLRQKYPQYDFAFVGCDNNLIGFFDDVTAIPKKVYPQTNEDDVYWETAFTFDESLASFPEFQLDFLATLQMWVCWVTSIVVTGEGGATTVGTGSDLQMLAAVLPLNATDTSVVWSVVNGTGTASISAGGLLTGGTAGTVTVVATANDASGVVGTLEITVV